MKREKEKVIGSVRVYKGTNFPKLTGERVVVLSVRRYDEVDEDTVVLRDDDLIQALRANDRVEIAPVMIAGDDTERPSGAVAEASPGELGPPEPEAAPETEPSFGRRW